MNLFFRTLLQLLRSRRAPTLDSHDVGRIRFRVLPTDLDLLGHMNNGVYLSIMDLGRMDLMVRSGAWATLQREGYYPVATATTMAYRKSLQPWQRFTLETRIVGLDDKAVYVEQRFVVKGEIYARGFMRGRFLKKTGGTVDMADLVRVLGIEGTAPELPNWLSAWSRESALPATRAEAPSDWS